MQVEQLDKPIPRCRGERGQLTIFVVVVMVAIIAMAGLVVDFGGALNAKMTAISTAEAAARAGSQALDGQGAKTNGVVQIGLTGAQAAAQGYLAAEGRSGSVSVKGATVTVTVTFPYKTVLLDAVGVDSIGVSGTGSATADYGVTSAKS